MKPKLKFDFFDDAKKHADDAKKHADDAKKHADGANKRPSFKKFNYKCSPVLDTDNKWYVSIKCHDVVIGHLWK